MVNAMTAHPSYTLQYTGMHQWRVVRGRLEPASLIAPPAYDTFQGFWIMRDAANQPIGEVIEWWKERQRESEANPLIMTTEIMKCTCVGTGCASPI